jgi:hypothetical protein
VRWRILGVVAVYRIGNDRIIFVDLVSVPRISELSSSSDEDL